jgi:hydroxyethylthiazole kinase
LQNFSQLADDAGRLLSQYRREDIPIHCIASSADESFTTRIFDAIGSIVSVTHDPREVSSIVQYCRALLVQMGPSNDMRESGIASAIEEIQKHRKPWVLDTLLASRSPFRTELLRTQLSHKPGIVRTTPEDMSAMMLKRQTTHVDFAVRFQTTTVSCAKDIFITDGIRTTQFAYGAPLARNFRMLSSARSALCTAMAVLERDAFKAACAALAITETAASVAADTADGPGSFSIAFLDALSFIEADAIAVYLQAPSTESED